MACFASMRVMVADSCFAGSPLTLTSRTMRWFVSAVAVVKCGQSAASLPYVMSVTHILFDASQREWRSST